MVSGHFDDFRATDARFLEAAAQRGPLTALLWSDALVEQATGRAPKFPLEERRYVLEAVRYLESVQVIDAPPETGSLPVNAGVWVMKTGEDSELRRAACRARGLECAVVAPVEYAGFPAWQRPTGPIPPAQPQGRKKVIVTGCYDWLHSGHVRFFEEVSQLGDLYVIVGNDANVRLLKGAGHPLFSQEERRYFVDTIRYVKEAWITGGSGWMDAAPEIDILQPDVYAVNEDGDKPEKRAFCQERGIEYVVLRRLPKPGLLRRESTQLRGF